MPREEECSIVEQRLLRFGLGAVLRARLRWPTSPRTGEMEGGFPLKNRDLQFSKFSQRAEILSFQMCFFSRAFLALLHHHRPELVDLSRMEEQDTITNCTEAFAIAEVSRDGGMV